MKSLASTSDAGVENLMLIRTILEHCKIPYDAYTQLSKNESLEFGLTFDENILAKKMKKVCKRIGMEVKKNG